MMMTMTKTVNNHLPTMQEWRMPIKLTYKLTKEAPPKPKTTKAETKKSQRLKKLIRALMKQPK